jgi:hypothetical protein
LNDNTGYICIWRPKGAKSADDELLLLLLDQEILFFPLSMGSNIVFNVAKTHLLLLLLGQVSQTEDSSAQIFSFINQIFT